MPVTSRRIAANLERIRERTAAACARSGRLPEEVSIVAVTKQVDLDIIRGLLEVGLTDLGENRAGQLTERAAEVDALVQRRRTPLPAPVRWHMIGHLQRNKVKGVLSAASVIHSVDSLRLAEEINKRAEAQAVRPEVLLEVNCSGEPQKHGCAVGAAAHMADLMAGMKHLRLVGLMTMAPLSEDPEQARPSFARLREIYEDMRREGAGGADLRHLSMGMSSDYVVAVEEGATMLRIGTALFE